MERDDDYDETDDGFESLAEKLQVGDATEGAEALRELVKKTGDIGNQVRHVLAQDRVQSEIQDALKGFEERYPEAVRDSDLSDVGMSLVRKEIAKDLQGLGIPEERIKEIRGSNQHMVQAYAAMRTGGQKVRTPRELMQAVGGEMERKLHIRPTAANGRSTVVRRDPADVPDRTQERIAQMRAQRDYRTDEEGMRGAGSSGGETVGSVRRVDPAQASARPDPRARIDAMRKARGYAPIDAE